MIDGCGSANRSFRRRRLDLRSELDRQPKASTRTANFEVTVKTAATHVAGGPSQIVVLATITDKQGHDVPNPVFEFDGIITTHG